MAKATLPTNFQDDILSEAMDGRRRYNLIQNSDGTVSLEDATDYSQIGSNFGAVQMNSTNTAVNESVDKAVVIDNKNDLMANTTSGKVAGALAVKNIASELNGNMAGYPNYSSRSKIIGNVNSDYTIQEDGFVKLLATPASNGTFAAYLNINNVNVFSVCIANAITPTTQSSQFFPVKAGDIVQQYGATNLGSDSGVWFYKKL